jgi:hypothetical protein
MDLRILVRRDLELVDGERDVLPGGRQHEVHPFLRASGFGPFLMIADEMIS